MKHRRLATAMLLFVASSASALEWGPEERVTANSTEAETGLNHGALALDGAGRIVAAWAEADGPRGNFRIYTSTREPSGVWDAPELAVDYAAEYVGTGLGAKFPALVRLAGDTLLMVWHDYRVSGIQNAEIFTKVRAPGEPWGDAVGEVRLTTSQHPETNGDNSLVPNLVVDRDGTAHVAWYDYRYDADHAEILFKSRVGGVWDTRPGDAPDTDVSENAGDSHFPALAAGPDGSLHLAWRDNTGGSYRILYRRRSPAGAWSATEALSPAGVAADGVTLAVAEDGAVLAAWADARSGTKAVYARERAAQGAWGSPRRVSPAGAGAEEPAAAVDPLGRRHLVWQDARLSVFNREIFYQTIPAGGRWDSTGASDTRLSEGSGKSSRPTLLLDPHGRVFVLWQDARHGASEIYFRAAGPAAGAVSLAPASARVRLWPNPFAAALHLDGLDGVGVSVRVFDASGRLRAELPVAAGRARWDVGSDAPAGVYFLELGEAATGRRIPVGKVLKVR